MILSGISIYDIQYTEDPGNGTYPSNYEGQNVTTGGIVTGMDFSNGRYFISSTLGGAWNGIYIYDNDHTVSLGDSIIVNGEVYEYWGFTEISSLESFELISSGNPLPSACAVSTLEVSNQEAFESVLVEVNDVVVTQVFDEWSEWKVSDGTGSCFISIGFFNLEDSGFPLILGYPFSSITGIVSYTWENFQLNPRNLDDLHSAPESYIISISEQYIFSPDEFDIPIYLSFLGEPQQVQTYQFDLEYNSEVLQYYGFIQNGTLSGTGSVSVEQPFDNIISVQYDGDFSFSGIQPLIKICFTGLNSGTADFQFPDFIMDGIDIYYFSIEQVFIQIGSVPIGDTLTVIQKPLLNIPQIVVPTEDLNIQCLADAATTGWTVELLCNNIVLSLTITENLYNTDLERWFLTAAVPVPDIYELYDLKVNANGIEADTTENAVHLIPERKDDYYFIHITDTHLPTHIFYPDPASITDTTEVTDFREVIQDINLIHPEFVLLTGDLVNEGELEDFENRRVYTKAQSLLSEFDVPVYLTSGNHDLGGWDSTPPPSGTARNDWWRFFGWEWLQNPPAVEPYYTQNYSFDYGPVHFIGMEAYLNYDGYMQYIYGDESFTALQMQWLDDNLQASSGSESRVLFYHYDFSEQIDLSNLDVDMALWGHIHSNSGEINVYPYNLATDNVCDEDRAYRLIRVNDGILEPTNTMYADWNGEMLQISFTPSNNGQADSVSAYIENQQDQAFENAQIKFIMPGNCSDYEVTNGNLEQVEDSGEFDICYVSVNIPANSNIDVSIVAGTTEIEQEIEYQNYSLRCYPNPFNPSEAGRSPTTTIQFSNEQNQQTEQIKIEIFNIKGQKIRQYSIFNNQSSIIWDGTDENGKSVTSGIYFYRLKTNVFSETKKMILIK